MWVQLFLWIATTLLTDYFREPLPAVTASGLGDFTIPTATEGRFVPLCFGTAIIQGPNVTWYGDFEAIKRTVTTGLIFKRDETIGFTYWLGLQMGLIRGQTHGIKRIWIGDDVVWDYNVDNAGVVSLVCDIDRPDLFGGEDSGGGFVGRIRCYDGSPTQMPSDYMLTRKRVLWDNPIIGSPQFEQTTRFTNLPAFRGFSYVIVTNLEEVRQVGPFGALQQTTPPETKGANIGEQNNLRHMKFEIQTFSTIAEGGLGNDLGLTGDMHIIGEDLNPICLAYDVFTNQDWGRGFSPADINLDNFRTTAETIYNEGLGFSIVIDQVQSAKDLIDTIEQHIDGYIGPNPIDGRMEVILARQDYDITASPEEVFFADATNIKTISKYSRGEYNQTFNEVRVQYTDRFKDYKDNYAPAQDLANLIIQGRPRTKTMRYSGVHDPTVANKIVWREMKGLAAALATATVELDRTAWNLQPGKVVVVTDEEVGIENIPFRIIQIRQGDPQRATIVIDIVEDVFGNEVVAFVDPPASEFIPPTAQAFAFLETQMFAMEAPYIINKNALDNPEIYPRLWTAASWLDAIRNVDVAVDQTVAGSPTGFGIYEPQMIGSSMTVGQLRGSLSGWQDGNGSFTITVDAARGDFNEIVGNHTPGGVGNLAGVCVIDPGGANEEFVITDSITWVGESPEVGAINLNNVYRAALDSNMNTHVAGELVWFIWTGASSTLSDKQWAVSNTLDVKLLPITQTDRVNLTDSPEPVSAGSVVIDSDERYAKPLLPIELNLNAVNFPTGEVSLDSSNTSVALSPESFVGILATPKWRIFRVENVIWQVTGNDDEGVVPPSTDFTDDTLTFSWWFYNQDASGMNSPMQRSDAVLSATDVPVTDSNTPFAILKSALEGIIEANSFLARLEIETHHKPYDIPGSPATDRVSREVMTYDFTATGLFVIDPATIELILSFDGDNGSRSAKDRGPKQWNVTPYGGVRISTAQSVFGGAAMDFPDQVAANAFNLSKGAYLVDIENQSPQRDFQTEDWTIEFRMRFPNTLSVGCLCGVGAGPSGSYSWQIDYAGGRFRWRPSQNGTTFTTLNINNSVIWSPSANTWYSIAIVHTDVQGTPDGNRFTLKLFIDGVLHDQRTITGTIFQSEPGPFHIGSAEMLDFDEDNSDQNNIFIDEFRLTFLPLYAANYTLATEPFGDEWSKYSLLLDFDPYAGTGSSEDVFGFRDLSVWDENVSSGRFLDAVPEGNPSSTHVEYVDAPIAWGSPRASIPALRCRGYNTVTRDDADGAWIGNTSGSVTSPQDWEQYEFGSGDWTMECWARAATKITGSPQPHGALNVDGFALLSKYNRPSGNRTEWIFYYAGLTGNVAFTFYPTGGISGGSRSLSSNIQNQISPITPDDLEWHHYAIQRRGRRVSIFLDGVMVASDGNFFGATEPMINSSAVPVGVGRLYDASVNSRVRAWNGWITEVRITKGEALYPDADAPGSPEPSPNNVTIPRDGSSSPIPSPIPVNPSPSYLKTGDTAFAVPTAPFPKAQFRSEDLPVLGDGVASDWVSTDMKFLCKWEGGIGSPGTGPVDESSFARVVTLEGSGFLDTSQSKFGQASLRCQIGSPNFSGASIPDDVIWDIDGDCFTLQTWIRFASLPTASPSTSQQAVMHIMGQWDHNNDRSFRMAVAAVDGSPNTYVLQYAQSRSGTSSTEEVISVPWVGLTTDTWYHVAQTRRGRMIWTFIDGVLESVDPLFQDSTVNHPIKLTFGYALDSAGTPKSQFDGWLDDTRIDIGAGSRTSGGFLYTEDFWPQEHVWHDTIFMPHGDYRIKGHVGVEDFSALGLTVVEDAGDSDWQIRDTLCPFADPPTAGFSESYCTSIEWLPNQSNSEIGFGETAACDLTDEEWTMSAWVYLFAQETNIIAGQYNATTNCSWFWAARADTLTFTYSEDGIEANTQQAAFHYGNVGVGSPANVSPTPDPSGSWHHIVVERDNDYGSPEGSIQRIRMYLDGVECIPVAGSPDATIVTGKSFHQSNGDITVGGVETGAGGQEMSGAVDQLRIVQGRALHRGVIELPTGRYNRF